MCKINNRKLKEIESWEANAFHDLDCEYEGKRANLRIVYGVVRELYQEGTTYMPLDPTQVLCDLRKVNQSLDSASKYSVLMEKYRKEFSK